MPLITKTQLADILKVTPRTVDNLRAGGMPFEKQGRKVLFDEDVCIAFYKDFNELNHKVGNEDYQTSRARKEAALARLAEIELEEKERQVVQVSEVLRMVDSEYTRVKARLLALPSKLSGEILGMQTQIEISEIIDLAIRDALDELSKPEEFEVKP